MLENLWSEVRKFLATLFYTIDILSAEITEMDVQTVCEEWQEAYEGGRGEPSFSVTSNVDFKAKHTIQNQEDFIYCKRTIDPAAAQQDAIISAGLSQAIQNTPNRSQEVRAAFKQSILHHSTMQ